MEHYDPEKPVDPKEWLALDENKRDYLAEQYHREKRIKMPDSRMHALIHVVVENQVALGDEIPAQKTLTRLMQEGLGRHDAIHAIGSVVARHIFDLLKHGPKDGDTNADYYHQLEQLTAEGWLNSFHEESEED